MWNLGSKKERGCAQVWWKVTTTGRLEPRLTTPVRSRAFFMRDGFCTRAGKVATEMATESLALTPEEIAECRAAGRREKKEASRAKMRAAQMRRRHGADYVDDAQWEAQAAVPKRKRHWAGRAVGLDAQKRGDISSACVRIARRDHIADDVRPVVDELSLEPEVAIAAYEIRKGWSALDHVSRAMWMFRARWEFPQLAMVTLVEGGAV